MSKVDAMRALREARMSAQAQASPAAPAARPTTARTTTPRTTTPRTAATRTAAEPAAAGPDAEVERCGHRNMGGRSCTRDVGHSEKNHRYS